MRKKARESRYWGYHRSPKTTQERRATGVRSDRDEYSHYEYARGKRRGKNLPNSYDDLRVAAYDERRCWKTQREKQYRCGSRGTKHELILDENKCNWSAECRLEEYFIEHDIPFKKERIWKQHSRIRYEVYKNIFVRNEPVYRKILNEDTGYFVEDRSKVWFYKSVWEQKAYNPPRYKFARYSTHEGTRFTYWTDKELNLDFAFAGP